MGKEKGEYREGNGEGTYGMFSIFPGQRLEDCQLTDTISCLRSSMERVHQVCYPR